MRKRLKRLVALLVTLAILLAMPGVAMAAESTEAEQPPPETSETADASTAEEAPEEPETADDADTSEIEETSEDAETVDTIDTSEAVGELTKVGEYLIDEAGLTYGQEPQLMGPLRALRMIVCPTYEEAYNTMLALKATYPEGMVWTNFTPYGRDGTLGDAYWWKGGYVKKARGGVGCAAFVFILSDAAFGNLPSRTIDAGMFTYDDVKVGDILRMGGHFVIVLQKSAGGVIVAEANYNKSVHWGRALSKAEVMDSLFLVTRYPENFVPSDAEDADDVAETGTEGSLGWALTRSGTLTITGNGPMSNFAPANLPSWSAHNDKISSIVIEQGITSVGDFAFYQSKALAVYIPDGVTKIGQSAFRESGLLAVTLPDTITTVDNDAFRKCQNLTSVSTTEGLQIVGERAFHSCTALTNIDFPASSTLIGSGAFTSCEKLVSVRFIPGANEVELGDDIFSQCWNLSILTLPQNITRIPNGTFSSCKLLATLYVPASVKNLGTAEDGSGNGPFASSGLKTIYFGGSQADWNSMTNAVINGSLQQMGTQVICNVEFEDPFAKDPDDPGDLVTEEPDVPPTEEDPCKDGHIGTADENGNCSECGKPIQTTPPVTPVDPPVDPAPDQHEHAWAEGWSNNATHHWHECGNEKCPITDEASKDSYDAHAYGDWVIDTNATASQSGSKHRDCTICTYRQTESIPATGGSSGGNHGGGTVVPPIRPTTPPSTPKPSPTATPNPPITGEPPLEPPVTGEPPLEPPISSSTTVTIDEETGTKTEITKNPDGSEATVVTYKDGTVTTTSTSAEGKTVVEVVLSADAFDENAQGEPIVLPIKSVALAQGETTDTTLTVRTGKDELVSVAIPVDSPTAKTVVVIVNADDSETIVKTSVPLADEMVVSLPDGATVKVIENSKDFSDVSSKSWFTEAVEFVSARELFAGTSKTTFSPESPMTRAMLMTVLARFDGVETAGGATWYDKSVEWAVEQGISDGSNPNNKITREQMVTMLWRYCGSPETNGVLPNYTDMDEISSYAQTAMNWAVRNGILSGFGDGRLGPKNQATRAQVAQILKNLIKNMTLS